MKQFHKHHIVPKWRCKELGIDPEFEDNYAYPTRQQHALIHWGYKCNDLKPLLEICNPPQYVKHMIPLGDSRDVAGAVILARGEIDQLDNTGKNNSNYKHGRAVGWMHDKKVQKENDKHRNAEYHKENAEIERARVRAYHYRRKGDIVNARKHFDVYVALKIEQPPNKNGNFKKKIPVWDEWINHYRKEYGT